MGSRMAGRGLKRFLEAIGFILAEFEPKPSHGDPMMLLGRMTCVGIQDICKECTNMEYPPPCHKHAVECFWGPVLS